MTPTRVQLSRAKGWRMPSVQRDSLIHYSYEPLLSVFDVERQASCDAKPFGLWVSPPGPKGWSAFCRSADYRDTRRQCAAKIIIDDGAKIMRVQTAAELDAFTELYATGSGRYSGIDWPRVASEYDGIVITPYIGARRLSNHTSWYYGWDCASGCIWRADAVVTIEHLRPAPGQPDHCHAAVLMELANR